MSIDVPIGPKISVSAYSEQQQREPEDQYYVFHAPNDTRRSLHVVDADYGVFESTNRQRKKNILLSPKNLIKKLKVSSKVNNDFISLPNNDDLNLRAEPELIDSAITRDDILFPSISQKRHARMNSREHHNLDSESEDNMSCRSELSSSATSTSSFEIGSGDKFGKCYTSQYKIPSLVNSNQLKSSFASNKCLKKNKLNSIKSSKMDALVIHNHLDENDDCIIQKARIELEYEKLKIKAARYQAERDAIKIKMKKREMSNQLRDYEYYCVNGVTHKTRKSQAKQLQINDNSKTPYYQIEYPQDTVLKSSSILKYRSRKRIQQRSQPSQPSFNIADNDFFGKISRLLPDEVIRTLEPYEPYIPTLKQVQKFHNETFSWLKCIPIISILSIFVRILGLFIPRKSTRSWSLRALVVAFVDLMILTLAGFSIYLVSLYTYRFFNAFYFLAKLLRIV